MTRLLLLAATIMGACGGDGDNGKFPIVAGGGGSGNSFRVDAYVDNADTNTSQTARVCLLADARNPTTCAASGADGLTVTAGNQQATTTADGTFTITRPTGTNLVWGVTGTGIEPTLMKYSATTTTIPALGTVLYDDMLGATQAFVVLGSGGIIAQVTRNATPVADATAIASPQPDSAVYYDGADAVMWVQDATNGFGVVWIPSIPAGTVSLSVDSGAVSNTDITGIPVAADAITFVFSELL